VTESQLGRRWRGVSGPIVHLALAYCVSIGCETSGDGQRLVLGSGSRLEVNPTCIAMPTPTGDGPVSVQSVVFARDKHGRPAESLQVSVQVGSCSEQGGVPTCIVPAPVASPGGGRSEGASAGVAASGAGGLDGGNAGGSPTGDAVATNGSAGRHSSVCTTVDRTDESECIAASAGQLAATRWAAVALAPSPGTTTCLQDGPGRLSCSLGPDGTASFDVLRNSSKTDINGFWVPLCLTAPTEGSQAALLRQEVAIALTSDAPVQASELMFQDLGPVPTSRPDRCNDPTASCTRGELMTLALVGKLSSDAGASGGGGGMSSGGGGGASGTSATSTGGSAGEAGAVSEAATPDAGVPNPENTPIAAQEQLHALLNIIPLSTSTSSPYLVPGTDCSGPTRINEVMFNAGSATSQAFSVCTNGSAVKYRLTASLLEQRNISAQVPDGRNFVPDAVRNVTVPVAPGDPFIVELCGGAVASSTQASVTGPGISLLGDRYVLSSPTDAATGGAVSGGSNATAGSSADAGEAGAASSASAGSSPSSGGSGGATSGTESARVTLQNGQSCTVEFSR